MSIRPSRCVFFLLCLVVAPSLWARCKSHPSQGAPQVVSFGTIQALADAPVGSVIAEKTTTGWNSPAFKCIKATRTSSLGIFTTGSSLGEGIRDTNVPGVGIRIYFFNSSYGELGVPENAPINWTFPAQLTNAHFRIQLVKTGEILTRGALTPGTLARAGYDNNTQAWVDLADAIVEPPAPTCAFTARQLVFALGTVDGRELKAAGSSPWATQQLVSAGCTNATAILMTFTGSADETDPSLFKVGGTQPATGVGVELRSDTPDAPAVPNSAAPMVLPAVGAGQSYGFRARYRTDGATLAPGDANASITVNVSYR